MSGRVHIGASGRPIFEPPRYETPFAARKPKASRASATPKTNNFAKYEATTSELALLQQFQPEHPFAVKARQLHGQMETVYAQNRKNAKKNRFLQSAKAAPGDSTRPANRGDHVPSNASSLLPLKKFKHPESKHAQATSLISPPTSSPSAPSAPSATSSTSAPSAPSTTSSTSVQSDHTALRPIAGAQTDLPISEANLPTTTQQPQHDASDAAMPEELEYHEKRATMNKVRFLPGRFDESLRNWNMLDLRREWPNLSETQRRVIKLTERHRQLAWPQRLRAPDEEIRLAGIALRSDPLVRDLSHKYPYAFSADMDARRGHAYQEYSHLCPPNKRRQSNSRSAQTVTAPTVQSTTNTLTQTSPNMSLAPEVDDNVDSATSKHSRSSSLSSSDEEERPTRQLKSVPRPVSSRTRDGLYMATLMPSIEADVSRPAMRFPECNRNANSSAQARHPRSDTPEVSIDEAITNQQQKSVSPPASPAINRNHSGDHNFSPTGRHNTVESSSSPDSMAAFVQRAKRAGTAPPKFSLKKHGGSEAREVFADLTSISASHNGTFLSRPSLHGPTTMLDTSDSGDKESDRLIDSALELLSDDVLGREQRSERPVTNVYELSDSEADDEEGEEVTAASPKEPLLMSRRFTGENATSSNNLESRSDNVGVRQSTPCPPSRRGRQVEPTTPKLSQPASKREPFAWLVTQQSPVGLNQRELAEGQAAQKSQVETASKAAVAGQDASSPTKSRSESKPTKGSKKRKQKDLHQSPLELDLRQTTLYSDRLKLILSSAETRQQARLHSRVPILPKRLASYLRHEQRNLRAERARVSEDLLRVNSSDAHARLAASLSLYDDAILVMDGELLIADLQALHNLHSHPAGTYGRARHAQGPSHASPLRHQPPALANHTRDRQSQDSDAPQHVRKRKQDAAGLNDYSPVKKKSKKDKTYHHYKATKAYDDTAHQDSRNSRPHHDTETRPTSRPSHRRPSSSGGARSGETSKTVNHTRAKVPSPAPSGEKERQRKPTLERHEKQKKHRAGFASNKSHSQSEKQTHTTGISSDRSRKAKVNAATQARSANALSPQRRHHSSRGERRKKKIKKRANVSKNVDTRNNSGGESEAINTAELRREFKKVTRMFLKALDSGKR